MATDRKKWLKRGIGFFFLTALAFCIWFYGPLAYGLWRSGVFDHPSDTHKYQGTSTDNLKSIRTALLSYEESEGQFPVAGGWMDAILNRLNTDDLKGGEASKKLVYPEYVGQAGKYGYAYNDALSARYHGDIRDPKTPMVFESATTEKNAHGDPAKIRRPVGLAIGLNGDILR